MSIRCEAMGGPASAESAMSPDHALGKNAPAALIYIFYNTIICFLKLQRCHYDCSDIYCCIGSRSVLR